MTYLQKLKTATNRKDLADILGFKASSLTFIIYKTPIQSRYRTFDIPKKSGGIRTIKAPCPQLNKLQTHLSHVLYECLAEIEKGRNTSPVSFGFRPTHSIIANARAHKRRRYVFNIDLEEFFPSIHFGRVRGFFLKDKNFALTDEVATTIAQIACDGTALPQGSPCSPIISELIGQILDIRMLRLAKRYGVRYSRYADDLTFSTNQKSFPEALAVQDPAHPEIWTPGNSLLNEIARSDFRNNATKTRMQFRTSQQTVTGLVVNQKVNIRSNYYRKARAMCDALFQTGQYHKPLTVGQGEDETPEMISSPNPLEGILGHIYTVTQSEEKRKESIQRSEPRAIRSLYRRFLFYKNCIALERPLIITEGKTDPVYLRNAIIRRPSFYPKLGSPAKDGFDFAVRFFNYEGRSCKIMDLGGGTGDLRSVVVDYLQNVSAGKSYSKRKPFGHIPMAHPVILVLDNDSGLASVAGTIKKNFDIQIDTGTMSDFYHITNNLYLVKTPETGREASIEDLFPEDLLKQKLNGKKFNAKNHIDTSKEYGKEIFAKHVVVPNAASIDFSGFDPLLDRIAKVIDDYAKNGRGAIIT